MNILIIKLGAIGDVLRTTAVLPGLKNKNNNCKIYWVTKKESFGILKNNSFLEKIFLNGDDELNQNNFDLIISLDDDLEACELASSLKTEKIIGAFFEKGERKYTNDSSLWFDMGLISKFRKKKADELKALNKETYQNILFKILEIDDDNYEPILNLTEKELEFGKKFAKKNGIDENQLVIGINTGAGGRWQDKKLSIEKTVELINKINNNLDGKIILFGGPEEVERNKSILEKINFEIIDAGCDNTLMEFASLINLCDVLVTSDSLALHIGVALKKKIVSFFYPTSAQEIELYGRGIKIKGKGDSYCSYQIKCDDPPEWDIDEFVNGVKKLLDSNR